MKLLRVLSLTFLFQICLKGNIILPPLYALSLDANAFQVGVIVALGSLFPIFLAPYVGRMSDHIRINYLMSIGMIGTALSLLIVPFWINSMIALFISQIFFGIFHIIVVVSGQNLVGMISTPETRSKNYGYYTLGVALANFVGPLIVGLAIDLKSYFYTYCFISLFALVAGVLFLFLKAPKQQITSKEDAQSVGFVELLRNPSLRTVFITSGIILTGVGLFEFYLPIYADALHFSASKIGALISINAVAFIISRLFMNALLRRYPAQSIIGVCLLIAAAAFFAIPFMSNFYILAALSFIMGLGLGCCQPLSITMAYDHSPAGHSGAVLGIRLTINKSVLFAVPILFGGLSFLGFFPIFWFNTILLGFGGSSLLNVFKKANVH